ncbi:MAG: rRNA pseudouridine synthase [bacterium]|nr:rRNA pseudouridine synthase [bacterium]
MMERLQKVLARAGVGSRRGVEELIREGRVTVNGRVAELGDRADLEHESIKVDGRRIHPFLRERRYLLLNKPGGYVSTVKDPQDRKTVMDLLPARLRTGLVPVGRLDFATEGLLLLTDDGELAQLVAHPRHGCTKTYEVKVKGRPSEEEIARLRQGILLDGRRTAPLTITALRGPKGPREAVGNSWWKVVLNEGRTRQIREMFFRIGHPVNRLRRVAIGPIADPGLPRGGWRELTAREVELLRGKRAQHPRKTGDG